MKIKHTYCSIIVLIIFNWIFAGSNCFTQFCFDPDTNVVVGMNPYSGLSGDFNGDGKADLGTLLMD